MGNNPQHTKKKGGEKSKQEQRGEERKSEDVQKIEGPLLPLLETGHMVFRVSLWRGALKQAADEQDKIEAVPTSPHVALLP
jgi:hypothetical protein